MQCNPKKLPAGFYQIEDLISEGKSLPLYTHIIVMSPQIIYVKRLDGSGFYRCTHTGFEVVIFD